MDTLLFGDPGENATMFQERFDLTKKIQEINKTLTPAAAVSLGRVIMTKFTYGDQYSDEVEALIRKTISEIRKKFNKSE